MPGLSGGSLRASTSSRSGSVGRILGQFVEDAFEPIEGLAGDPRGIEKVATQRDDGRHDQANRSEQGAQRRADDADHRRDPAPHSGNHRSRCGNNRAYHPDEADNARDPTSNHADDRTE